MNGLTFLARAKPLLHCSVSSVVRVWRTLGKLAAVLILATLTSVAAHSATTTCTEQFVPVNLPLPVGPQTVYGQLCVPNSIKSSTVQVLIHGLTYSHSYWDWSYKPVIYSYVRVMNAAGYSTFAIDRIGIGKSSHPPSVAITLETNAYVVHQLVQGLRSGAIGGKGFSRVITVGHSYGSLTAVVESSTWNDVDGVILTGMSHVFSALGPLILLPTLTFTWLDPILAPQKLPLSYLTTLVGTRQNSFYYAPNADPLVVALDEQTKATVTLTEVATVLDYMVATFAIKAPVLVVNGDFDQLFCGLLPPCSSPLSTFNLESTFYPNAKSYQQVVIPNAGHSINLQRNAQVWFAIARNWVDTLASGRTPAGVKK